MNQEIFKFVPLWLITSTTCQSIHISSHVKNLQYNIAIKRPSGNFAFDSLTLKIIGLQLIPFVHGRAFILQIRSVVRNYTYFVNVCSTQWMEIWSWKCVCLSKYTQFTSHGNYNNVLFIHGKHIYTKRTLIFQHELCIMQMSSRNPYITI